MQKPRLFVRTVSAHLTPLHCPQRVWWCPTEDEEKTDYSGAWWPGALRMRDAILL